MLLAVTWPAAASKRCDAHGAEAPAVNAGEGIGEGGAQAGDLRPTGAPSPEQDIRPDQQGHAGEPGQQGGDLGAVDLFVVGQHVGDHAG